MTRKLSPLAVAALTGALGIGTTPLWAGGQHRDQMSMEQSPELHDQTQVNGDWSGTARNQMSAQKVEEVQQALKQQGYDPGPIDGVLDAETQAAIESFQQSAGLAATGQLDEQTMAQLGINEHSSEQGAARYEGGPTESDDRSARSRSSSDFDSTSTHSAESSPSS